MKRTATKLPLVVYTLSGGWAAGSKHGITSSSVKSLYLPLLDKGLTVASVNYRLSNKGGTVLSVQ